MGESFSLDQVDWHRIVDEMNVGFGMFRYEPATAAEPSDIFLLYANHTYTGHLEKAGFDLETLRTVGYVHSGNVLDLQMRHDIVDAIQQRIQVRGKLYVTSMHVWIDYYITPLPQKDCYYIVIIDIDEEQRYLAELERLGLMDALTDVGNRNALQIACNKLRETAVSLGILVADLNGLKQVNDSRGHAAGDRAIVEAARLLTETFPDWDVYRFGGDEFVMLAVGVSETAFKQATDAFVAECCSGDEPIMSAGVAWGASSAQLDRIGHEADDGMYLMKRAYYQTHDRRH